PVRLAISRSGTFSRKYIRLILANMPTVITSVSPAQRLSRAFNHVGQNSMKTTASGGSVLRGHQQVKTRFNLIMSYLSTWTYMD
ncbi:hypothetical protein, partial [Burkholderia vietnamiensis]|uniref:hypothetical protein n=1 Tax=Burkholderia vietnamiensis TaxID=60552 RepID=UPI001CF49393